MIGGWCPPGRICESGTIPPEFELEETPRERSSEAMEIPRYYNREIMRIWERRGRFVAQIRMAARFLSVLREIKMQPVI
jgi:hypothetical protein